MMLRDDGWRGLRRVFRLPGSRRRADSDVDAELHFHLDGRIDELVEREHLSRDEAEREARRRFGNYDAYRREARAIDDRLVRGRQRMELFDTIAREARQSARALIRTPSFSVIAFATLVIGIAATTAIYTVLDAVVLQPLPYRDPAALVSVHHPATVPGSGEATWGLSQAGYFYFKNQNHTLTDLGVYTAGAVTVTNDDRAESVRGGFVSASLFTTLDARPALGRLISTADDAPHGPDVAVLSYVYWQRRFGGDRGIVGKILQTSGGPEQIVGVAEPGLTLPRPGAFSSTSDVASFGVDVWMPLHLDPNAPAVNAHGYAGIGRLRNGVTPAEAQRDLASLMTRFTTLFPTAYSPSFMHDYNFRVGVTPLRDEVVGATVRQSLWLLFGAVAVVLFIACANVANLFLVRVEARRRESALRAAIGATRGHLAIHHVVESLMLTVSAGVVGLLVAHGALRALLAVAPTDIPRLATVRMGGGTIAFAALLSVAAGLVFGLMPVLRREVDVSSLRDGGRGLTSSRTQRTVRGGLVVGQVALALVLLAAAGLMLRSFANLRRVRPGLDPHGVLTFDVSLPWVEYKDLASAYPFHVELARRIAALPGVTHVGAGDALPLRDMTSGCTAVVVEGQTYETGKTPCVSTPAVTPGFFDALGIHVRGALPQWTDIDPTRKTPATTVVTQALADRLWPHESAIGKGMRIGGDAGGGGGYYRVVGVIPELRAKGLDQPPTEAALWAGVEHGEEYVVRTALSDPSTLMPRVRQIVASMNPRVPVTNVSTMDDVVQRSVARASFLMTLLLLAGGMALLLSAVGIYGVISYVVAQRRSEIGIRMALGARVPQVAALVLAQSMRLVALGVAIGVVGALAGTRLLRSLLFDVSPTDPWVLGGTAAVLVVIAVAASLAPARRATRVDPVEAMREA
jgi:predicted permease